MTPPVVKPWNHLTLDELYSFLKLRCDVFMWEQKADDEELDGRDQEPGTIHVWIADELGCAAYLRVLHNAVAEYRDAHRVIGRVAVRADRRGDGLARDLIRRALEVIDEEGAASMLHAQSYVAGLYERFGYECFGDEYDEAGIAHRSMYRAGRSADAPLTAASS